jgi:hypothetical protein
MSPFAADARNRQDTTMKNLALALLARDEAGLLLALGLLALGAAASH